MLAPQAVAAHHDSALQEVLTLPLGLPDARLPLSDVTLLLQRRLALLTLSLPCPPQTVSTPWPRRVLLLSLLLCSSLPLLALFQGRRPQRAQAPLLLAR